MIKSKQFYVYIYHDPREGKGNAPIYVGKGSGYRAGMHWSRGTHNNILQRILDKIRAIGLSPVITVINTAKEKAALDIEKQLIAIYGRMRLGDGTLCNITDGGEGVSAGSLSDEHKARISIGMSGKHRTPEHCANLSTSLTGKKHSAETLAKISENSKRQASDPAFRKRISEALKGRKLPKELAEQRSAQLKALSQNPERRAQISLQMKARHAANRARKAEEIKLNAQ